MAFSLLSATGPGATRWGPASLRLNVALADARAADLTVGTLPSGSNLISQAAERIEKRKKAALAALLSSLT